MTTYVWRDGKVIPKDEAEPLRQSSGPSHYVAPDYKPFKSPMGHGVIDGKRQMREIMARENVRIAEKGEWNPVYKNPSFAARRGLPLNGEKG